MQVFWACLPAEILLQTQEETLPSTAAGEEGGSCQRGTSAASIRHSAEPLSLGFCNVRAMCVVSLCGVKICLHACSSKLVGRLLNGDSCPEERELGGSGSTGVREAAA